jgi:DNA polymerase-4
MRKVLHVDMDAFYASVEQRDNPAIRGKPVAVGGDPRGRGVVCAASYEARRYGVRSAIPMSRAIRLCPGLIVVRPDFSKYRAVSQQVFAIYRAVTPLVEPLSLDEAYLDVTVNAWDEPLAVKVARRVKAQILETTGLTASAGVAPNKFLAKIASGWKKPDGLTVVPPERVDAFVRSLPVDALWGVGPKTAARLREHGLHTLADVRARPLHDLQGLVGSLAEWLLALSHGQDDRPVEPNRPTKQSGSESTYPEDLTKRADIRREVDEMARDAATWLERRHVFARTVVLKVRYSDFTTITRSQSTPTATRDADELSARALALLDRTEAGRRPVRLLGVSVHGFSDSPQPPAARDTAARLPFETP